MNASKLCFIITPIGSDKSEIRFKTDKLIDSLIKPTLSDADIDLELSVAHRIDGPGNILDDIVEHVLYDKLVIANLSGMNPNVMFELAVRLCTGLPYVIIAETGTQLPFDIDKERTIFYNPKIKELKKLKQDLKKSIVVALKEEPLENTITKAAKLAGIRNSTLEKASDLIVDLFEDLYSRVGDLSESVNSIPSWLSEAFETCIYSELIGYSFKIGVENSGEALVRELTHNELIANAGVTTYPDYNLVIVFSKNSDFKLDELKDLTSKFGIEAYDFKKIKGHFPPH